MPTKVVYVHGMGGGPEDWRTVQSRQPGLSLQLDASAETPEAAAKKLADQVVSLASGSFALCGYSLGGRMALLAARDLINRKKKPDGIILVSAGLGFADEAERSERNAKDEEWATLAASNSEEFWKKWYEQDIFASFASVAEASRAAWMDQRKALDSETISGQLRHLGPGRHGDLVPVLKEILAKGVKVYYIAGALDKKYVAVSEQVKAMPGTLVDQIVGAGHIVPLEAPDALAQRIAKFIK
jgi:2-succinyl-6-hydroxy-2,4-cyclohexadiene-1-carboxylate synthase